VNQSDQSKMGALLGEQEVNGGGGLAAKGAGLIKVNQSNQSKIHMSLAEEARVEKARGGDRGETGEGRPETGKKGRAVGNQSDQSDPPTFRGVLAPGARRARADAVADLCEVGVRGWA